jgi:eukaryotic-like serine/threonine-protein kinase
MEIKLHLEMRRGGTVTGPIEGAYGEVYLIKYPANTFPGQAAAKCPRLKRFGSADKARAGVEQMLHELEKTHELFMVPWINRFFDVQIIYGWPFILSRYHDGTLDDLIANPLAWSTQDRFVSLIQIVRALIMAQTHGVSSHQDLKPANVFFADLTRKNMPKESKGMHFRMFVGDFGLADAFRELGRNNGSRPYMAPEQFSAGPMNPTAEAKFDIFALGVMTFECFTDGCHPIGVKTADVWPRHQGIPQKWGRESTWREWAGEQDKVLPDVSTPLPAGMFDLVSSALQADPAKRPTLVEFEKKLWDALTSFDADTAFGLRQQIDDLEGQCSSEDKWPHMHKRLMQLRQFYGEL